MTPLPPTLRMGLVGFADTTQLARLLATRSVAARWQPWGAAEADALWINGAAARPLDGGVVLVQAPGQPPVRLQLGDPGRPVAFTVPAPGIPARPPATFDPLEPRSIAAVLADTERRLQPLAAQLALARAIADRRRALQSPVYHLEHRGTLVAVVDTGGWVALSPQARAGELLLCDWHGRPRGAAGVPGGFERLPLARLMWQLFVRGDDQPSLPRRYRREPLYFRQVPPVPPQLLRDDHLAVLAALQRAPHTAGELQRRLALPPRRLDAALAALGYASAITTDPARAASGQGPLATVHSGPSLLGPSDLSSSQGSGLDELDTVIAPWVPAATA